MNYINRIEFWGDKHHPKYLDILRIVFGIFLCFKGIQFAHNSALLTDAMENQVPFSSLMIIILVHYIIFAHVTGGFLIAVGLLTRVACLIQIPILIGALIFVKWDILNYFSEFFMSLLTLVLLCLFFVIGSGPWSLNKLMWNEQGENR